MLRPLRAAELSDGTLRFLRWAAALLEAAGDKAVEIDPYLPLGLIPLCLPGQ